MSKRTFAKAKRPVEKIMINTNQDAVGTTQTEKTLHTSTVAETLSRTIGMGSHLAGAGGTSGVVLIVLAEDGGAISTVNLADAAIPYEPEQDVLWITRFQPSTVAEPVLIDTKAQRKMLKGDRIVMILKGEAADAFDWVASLTMFFKQ